MTKRQIDKVWAECLAMWRWVAKHETTGGVKLDRRGIALLKSVWLRDHHPKKELYLDCSFCEVQHQSGAGVVNPGHCRACPGRMVDPYFNCETEGRKWNDNPAEFYAHLKKLNRRRLARQRKAEGRK